MQNTQLSKEVRRWLNRPQMMALMCGARILAVKAGRRLGKSEELGAERTLRSAYLLKGSSGFVSGRSYSKLLEHLLPGLIAGWNKRGLMEGIDFVIGINPPKHFKRPILPPKSFAHYISFEWGSGIHLISFDHGSTSNGLTTDFGLVDEAKQIDPVRLGTELLKTMNGHGSVAIDRKTKWRDVPEHLMLTILSDAYIGKYDFDWIGRYKKESISSDELLWILYLVEEVQKSNDEELKRYLWKLQCESTVYLEASTEENLAALGVEYFELQAKNSSKIEFRTSILNEDVKQIEGGFYKFLDEAIHTYEARDNNRIDSIGISDYLKGKGKNCLLDRDHRKDLPLLIGIDYGTAHTWFVVAQKHSNTCWVLNNFWTKDQQISEGVDSVVSYYKYQEEKVAYIYDDPQGHKKKTDQVRDIDLVISAFRKRGWKVVHKTPDDAYIPHHTKYRLYEKGLEERKERRDERFLHLRFNLNNAYQCFYSCSKAGVKRSTQDEYQKDKQPEKDKNLEQWKAPHLSDALDNIYCTENLHLMPGYEKWTFVW